MVLSLFILLAVTIAVWLWLILWQPPTVTVTFEQPDPYAEDIAAFRRQLHDWDRRV